MATTARATLTRADEVYLGPVQKAGYSPDGRSGLKLDMLKFIDLGVPATADADAILNDVTTFTNSTVTVTAGGLLLTALDVPRNLTMVAATTAHTQVVRVTGTDQYGDVMIEDLTLNGTTAVSGVKAFKGLTSIVIPPGAAASTIDVGYGDVLGIPYRFSTSTHAIGGLLVNNVVNTTATFVTGLATTVTATAANGDVRGTVVSTGSLPNNSRRYSLLLNIPDLASTEAVFGVDNFDG